MNMQTMTPNDESGAGRTSTDASVGDAGAVARTPVVRARKERECPRAEFPRTHRAEKGREESSGRDRSLARKGSGASVRALLTRSVDSSRERA